MERAAVVREPLSVSKLRIPDELGWIEPRALRQRLETFYRNRDHRPVWWVNGNLVLEADELSQLLVRCPTLPDQTLPITERRWRTFARWSSLTEAPPRARIRIDVDLTANLLLCAERALERDRELARRTGWPLAEERSSPQAERFLQTLSADVGFEEAVGVLDTLAPPHPQTEALGQAFLRYRSLAEAGGWPRLPDGPTLEPGARAAPHRLKALRDRLGAEGFLDESAVPAADVYSPDLVSAVRDFQRSRGLGADGKIGPSTATALNVPVTTLLDTLRVNLVRSRWLPAPPDRPYVTVNIPAFELIAYGRKGSRRFRVIVGRPDWPSPLLWEQIESLVANPDWHVPESIARVEVIPRLRENPALVHEEGFEIYDGWGSDAVQLDVAEIRWLNTLREGGQLPHIVQRTGPHNPLGRLKMVFPNQENVYLHDTSAPGLFEKTSRALSHGCIRAEDPLGIVEVLMGRAAAEQTQRAVATGRRKNFQLLEKIPIEIIYLTAWAREDGTVEFYGDVYDQDPSLAGLLRADTGARSASARSADARSGGRAS